MNSTSKPSLRSSGRSAHSESRAPTGQESLAATPAASTRRAANPNPLPIIVETTSVARKRLKLNPGTPKPTSKKSTATVSKSAARERPRPPTRVTVTQPHGNLLQTTNGVRKTLDIVADDLSSHQLTLKTNERSESLLSPNTDTEKKEDKRSLRSHGAGSRLKSDLAIYFSNYDDVINDAPREPEFLDLDTPILVTDESIKAGIAQAMTPSPSKTSLSPKSRRPSIKSSTHTVERRSSQMNFPIIDFSTLYRHAHHDPSQEDPLDDKVFFAPHRRAERKEKQLRNIEKERAMHEKVHLDRLLEGLQGPDWLRIMGISGVTDGEKRDWEPKRNYFLSEVQALVDKFRIWKEGEKRQRAEKEAALLAREEEEAASKAHSEVDDEPTTPAEDSDAPNSSDIDASAAHQLLQEASSASVIARRPKAHPPVVYLHPPEPESNEPFTSFFAKPHLRASALGSHRHGRTALAFGQPVPEVADTEFTLPHDYLTPEALKDHARKKRRMKRESTGNVK
ncbi:hypothetical protein EJ05DRAFT_514206 [Pseudovirgaria hyperparasitica]|uniref:Something about silencing protein 4 domain-containing protein n=1 Tax=Pseudovirgaria hyperparasitica TaxID=470096 RepID=A0A6A6VWV8_9PEZI|nr:uncharacterized protein EJ05DRAFT_514206 [Pseudovirgaria hyperparasitica]KAF2754194.1 hypothetical protein EJ05DRAFT_514206 [Pseudovirgaria hyperparasitica]